MAESYYAEITDRPVVCDKNRGWSHYYEWVEQWNPEPKMICMVRDLRSVVASMERVYRKNRHRPIGPDNPAEMQNMTVNQRAESWLNSQPIGLALQRLYDGLQKKLPILIIRYENLCDTPQETMNQVYEFLGEQSYQHDFENLKKEVVEDCSYFGPYGNHNVQPKINPPKRNDWEDVLPSDVATMIRKSNQWYFDTLGY